MTDEVPPDASELNGSARSAAQSNSAAPARLSTPARVRVTAPSTGIAGASTRPVQQLSHGGPTSDIAGVYVRSLIRSQLRLAAILTAGFVVATVMFVLALVVVPGIDESYVFGVPVSWALLGVGIYPLTLTVAILYVRIAARNEARYRSLVAPE